MKKEKGKKKKEKRGKAISRNLWMLGNIDKYRKKAGCILTVICIYCKR